MAADLGIVIGLITVIDHPHWPAQSVAFVMLLNRKLQTIDFIWMPVHITVYMYTYTAVQAVVNSYLVLNLVQVQVTVICQM